MDHLLAARRRGDLHRFAEQGAAFAITAVESFSDEVVGHLAKGHTRAQTLDLFGDPCPAPLPLRPTFVAFTPWTSRGDYQEIFDILEANDLVSNVDPVQLSIRLLIPEGAALLAHPPTQPHLTGPYDAHTLTYPWRHPDAAMDHLHARALATVEAAADADTPPEQTYEALRALAFEAPPRPIRTRGAAVPRMSESWFCCSEPTACQTALL